MHVFGCAFKFSVLAIALLPSGQNLEVNTQKNEVQKIPQGDFLLFVPLPYYAFLMCSGFSQN